ncbi:hypothetical protein GH714_030892 [Hevea brasiliensis]|uniref:Large ribosomal subunit protein bL32m n=1 Tax=Hevea brasiliensis TaxID=3981 RepID=A0A6A6LHT3_HEVBR|nr:hypothetical protein GH714_030892 [Hevea brasiliensis]
MLALLRWFHIMPPLLDGSLHRTIAPPQMVSPEFDPNPDNSSSRYINNLESGLPSFSSGGSMELMAVPKKKVSPHKRGIRNGPKALKPTPVIFRCRQNDKANDDQDAGKVLTSHSFLPFACRFLGRVVIVRRSGSLLEDAGVAWDPHRPLVLAGQNYWS